MDVHWTLAALREMDRRLVALKMIDCRACGRPERMRVEPRPALIYLGEQQYPEMYFEIPATSAATPSSGSGGPSSTQTTCTGT